MIAGGEDERFHHRAVYMIYMCRRGRGQGETQRAVGGEDAQAVDRFVGYGADHVEEAGVGLAAAVVGGGGYGGLSFLMDG